jgi:hypothetical protein
MNGPVQRGADWWQFHNDTWFKWNATAAAWERASGPPPPPPPATSMGAAAGPVGTTTGAAPQTERTRPNSPSDDSRRYDETWGSAKVTPGVPGVGWEASRAASTASSAGSQAVGKLVVVAVALLAVLGAGWVFFLKGPAGPAAEEVAAAFRPVPGYTYEPVPRAITAQVDKLMADNPGLYGEVTEWEARQVFQNGQLTGVVVVIGVDPAMLQGQDVDVSDFSLSLENGPQLNFRAVERGGVTMYETTAPGAAATAFFDQEKGLVYSVTTRNVVSTRTLSDHLAGATVLDAAGAELDKLR